MGDSLVVDRVFKSCIMTTSNVETYADLIVLDMLDFNMILGMDWLSYYHAVMDCFSKIVTLAMTDIPLVMWQEAVSHKSKGIILYVYARRLISKGYESSLAYICDTHVESSTLDSIPVVYKFPEVFLDNMPAIAPDHDIEFVINLEPGTRPISTTPTIWLLPSLRR